MQSNLGSRTPLITNKSVHEQIFRKKKFRVTNGVSSNEHVSWQQTVGDKLGVSAGERQLLCNFRSVQIVSVYEHFG
jgi:hypothetical protein